ncbi:MAG: spermidine synthase [Planctomycetaceae bacterium]|nr:spermidine synthase [Planctomycetaceae bacterium]
MNDNDTNTIRTRFAHVVLAVSMLVMGACGIIYEYTLGVLGNNLMGSSHEQLFVIIGLMMFAMGAGAVLQQRLVGNLIDKFLWVELLLGLLGGISTLVIYATFVFTDSYQLVMYAFSLGIGVLIGCEIPLLIRINTEYTNTLRANLSSILSMDYVGSLIGALLFAYVLLTRLSVERISLILGCVNILLAIAGVAFFWPMVKRRQLFLVACGLAAATLGVGLSQSRTWMAELQQRCFVDPIVYSKTTKYQHIVLTESIPEDRLRLYLDGHLQFSSDDEAIYHEMLVHPPMSLARSRQRILILGGGDGLALREVLKYSDVESVVLVDIDPAIIELAREHPKLVSINGNALQDARVETRLPEGVGEGPESPVWRPTKRDPLVDNTEYKIADVTVATVDADLFLRNVNEKFDVVIIDFPDPRSVELGKLFSVDFYRQLTRRLSDGAVVSIQSTNIFRGELVFRCIGETLKTAEYNVLPYHEHVPSFGEWGWHLAWHGKDSAAMKARIKELKQFAVPTTHLTPEVLGAAFIFGKDWQNLEEVILPNTKMQPVVMQYYRRSLGKRAP